MTCIVGIIHKEKVWIGGDSAGVDSDTLYVEDRKDPKVFKVGEFVIGCTTSFRMIDILKYSVKFPPVRKNENLHKYMCTKFITAIRKAFKKEGFLKDKISGEFGGEFLVAVRNRLFKVYEDFQVAENKIEYNACGCGDMFALGCFYGLPLDMDAESKITSALNAASKFSGGVRPPFTILHT